MSAQIFIRNEGTGKTYTLDVDLTDTIQNAKWKTEDKTGIPAKLMKLKYGKHTSLQDGRTLSDYDIHRESTLHLRLINAYNHILYCERAYARPVEHTPDIATCPAMKNDKICSVYLDLIKYNYTDDALKHMQTYQHYGLKMRRCRYGLNCYAYQRLINNGTRLDDRCHVCVCSHPPRRRQEYAELDSNVATMICGSVKAKYEAMWQKNADGGHDSEEAKHEFHKFVKDWQFPQSYVSEVLKCEDDDDQLLYLLIEEVENNSDTTKLTAHDGNYKLDLITASGKPLVEFAKETYLNHPRHVKMGRPLSLCGIFALVLYTGTACNYDLCKSQRTGNFRKWPIFDYCLNRAIWQLAIHEEGTYPVYTGLGSCQIDFKRMNEPWGHYFTTYLSTSWDVNVAKQFLEMNGGRGVIIGIGPGSRAKAVACDVSWISKFGDAEKEVLFSRLQNGASWRFEYRDNIGNTQRVIAIKDRDDHVDYLDLFSSWDDSAMTNNTIVTNINTAAQYGSKKKNCIVM